jgi:DNA mismatch repair ATPase MutS
MESSLDQIADETIELLEARLQRIEYAVTGQRVQGAVKDDARPAIKRLEDLERSLNRLVTKSRVMQDLLKIRKSPYYSYINTTC